MCLHYIYVLLKPKKPDNVSQKPQKTANRPKRNYMTWTQLTDPLHNLAFSALAAAIPIFFIFWALIIKKMKGYQASLITAIIAILLAVFLYGMPVKLAILSTIYGALYGLFPICWIIGSISTASIRLAP